MPELLVKDLMSTPVVSLLAEQTLPLVEDIMTFKHVRHLPVIELSGRLVGLVSHRDLLRAQISTLAGLTDRQRRARQAHVVVRDIMTANLWTVTPHTTAVAAARILSEHRIGCLPVADSDGTLAGIITERDFLSYALRTLEGLAAPRAAQGAQTAPPTIAQLLHRDVAAAQLLHTIAARVRPSAGTELAQLHVMHSSEIVVYDYVNHPYARVRRALLAGPRHVFRQATAAETVDGAVLRFDVAGVHLGVEIAVDVVRVDDETGPRPHLVIGLSWEAVKHPRAFPMMTATLRAFPITPTQTQLLVEGTYVPPLGPVGALVDAALARPVAEAAIAQFLRQVAAYLREHLVAADAGLS